MKKNMVISKYVLLLNELYYQIMITRPMQIVPKHKRMYTVFSYDLSTTPFNSINKIIVSFFLNECSCEKMLSFRDSLNLKKNEKVTIDLCQVIWIIVHCYELKSNSNKYVEWKSLYPNMLACSFNHFVALTLTKSIETFDCIQTYT